MITEEDCVYGTIDNVYVSWSKVCIWRSSIYDALGLSKKLEDIIWQLSIDGYIFTIIFKLILLLIRFFNLLLIPIAIIGSIASKSTVLLLLTLMLGIDFQKKSSFRGLIYTADFPKNIKGHTLIFSKRDTIKLVNNIKQYSLVGLEDLDFDSTYFVYSNDQIETRYILSTSLMYRLSKFNKKAKYKIRYRFIKTY